MAEQKFSCIAIQRQGAVQKFKIFSEYIEECRDVPGLMICDKEKELESLPVLTFSGLLNLLPPKIRGQVEFKYEGKKEMDNIITKLPNLISNPEKYQKEKEKVFYRLKKYDLSDEWINHYSAEIAKTSPIKLDGSEIKKEFDFKKSIKKEKPVVGEPVILKKSLFINEEKMYEQVRRNDQNLFICYSFKNNTLIETDFIDDEEPIYPIDDEEVAEGHIRLPTHAQEYGSEEQLIKEIESHVTKYLDVPDDYLHYASLNILKSWVYERYRSLNYLRVQGEPGTGKSRFLDVIGGLHYKPIATSGASTVSPIFRLMNKWGCTLIMDEADLKQSDETNDLIKIINQGFEKDRPVIRCNPDDKSRVEFFKVYCPKVLSTRHAFEDVATESRCMTQIMNGTSRTNIISSLNDEFYKEQSDLRNKLLLWRFRNYRQILPDIGESLDWLGVEPRLKQTNVGFISLIYNDKPYLQKFMERIKLQQISLRNERSETIEGHIISACSRIMLDEKPILAKLIVDYADLTDTKGLKWKPRRIASYMKTLGFLGTRLERIEGTPEKVYQFENNVLKSLFKKYLTEDEEKDFFIQCEKKSSQMTQSIYHKFFCNYVTIVTNVYEQGKNGYKPENEQKQAIVTNGVAPTKDGYNGYKVTNDEDSYVPTKSELSSGDYFEPKPGIYKKVI